VKTLGEANEDDEDDMSTWVGVLGDTRAQRDCGAELPSTCTCLHGGCALCCVTSRGLQEVVRTWQFKDRVQTIMSLPDLAPHLLLTG
jgi:hypothetical protein